jgi:hypothetical protein
MGDTAVWAVVVAAIAVIANAFVSIFLHFRRANFEEDLAKRKFDYDVTLAERKATLEYLSAYYQRRQELAGEILAAFYEVQRMMPAIRSPGSFGVEGASRPASTVKEAPDVERMCNAYYVTIERLDKNRETIVRFLSKQFSAMALLGSDVGKPFEGLNQILNRIIGSANMLIMTAGNDKPPQATEKWHADIWEGYGDAEDQVQIQLNKITEAIEAICKPILSAKAPALVDVSND